MWDRIAGERKEESADLDRRRQAAKKAEADAVNAAKRAEQAAKEERAARKAGRDAGAGGSGGGDGKILKEAAADIKKAALQPPLFLTI